MRRKQTEAYLTIIGFVLLFALALLLPLQTAAAPPGVSLAQGDGVSLRLEPITQTLSVGSRFVVTATVRNDTAMTLTNLVLRLQTTPIAFMDATEIGDTWKTLGPGASVVYTASRPVKSGFISPRNLQFELRYIVTGTLQSVTETLRVLPGPPAVTTLTPEPETPTPTETATVTPAQTSTATPTVALTLTQTTPPVAPSPSPTLTPPPNGFLGWVTENPLWFAGGMVALLGLLFLALLAVLLSRRKRRQRKRAGTGTRPIKPLKPVVPPPAPAPARLVCADAAGKSQTFALNPEGVAIGRAEDNVLVIGPALPGWESVSQHHARIFRRGEEWIVTDLNSHNGVYVNDRRTGRNLLRDGWKLRVGGVLFTFRAGKGA